MQTIHHEALQTDGCPIRALIRCVKHIQQHSNNPNTILGSYFPSNTNKERTLLASDMNTAIKSAISQLGLPKYGLQPDHVGSHSLRAGGAMAMHLNGIPHNVIKKMGRWSTDTFLMYIHEHISAYSAGISAQMTKPIHFRNIAFQPASGPLLHSPAA